MILSSIVIVPTLWALITILSSCLLLHTPAWPGLVRPFKWVLSHPGAHSCHICPFYSDKPTSHNEALICNSLVSFAASCVPQPLISGDHSIQFPQGFSASSYKDDQHKPEDCRMIPSNNGKFLLALGRLLLDKLSLIDEYTLTAGASGHKAEVWNT